MRENIIELNRTTLFTMLLLLTFSLYFSLGSLSVIAFPYQDCPGQEYCPDENSSVQPIQRFGAGANHVGGPPHIGYTGWGEQTYMSNWDAWYPAAISHSWSEPKSVYRARSDNNIHRGYRLFALPRCPYDTSLLLYDGGDENYVTSYCACGGETDRYTVEVKEGNYCEDNYVPCVDGDCQGESDYRMTGYLPRTGPEDAQFTFSVDNGGEYTRHPKTDSCSGWGGVQRGYDRFSTWFKPSEDISNFYLNVIADDGQSTGALYRLNSDNRLERIFDEVTSSERLTGDTSDNNYYEADGPPGSAGWRHHRSIDETETIPRNNGPGIDLNKDDWYFVFYEPRRKRGNACWRARFYTSQEDAQNGDATPMSEFTDHVNSFGPLGVYARDDPEFCGGGSKTPEFTNELPEDENLENTACSEIATYQLIDVQHDTTDEEHANACRSIGCPAPGEPANRCEVDREVFDHLEENTNNHHFDNSEARCSFEMCNAIGEGSVDLREDKDRRGQVDNTGEYACVMSNQLTSDVNSYSYVENTGDAGWYFSTRQSWLLDEGSWENCPAWASSENKECIDTPTDSNRHTEDNEGPASIDVQRPTMCVQDTEEADGNMLKQFEGDKDYGIAPIAYLDGTEKSIYFNTTGEPEAVWETTTANSINQDQLIDSIGREEYEFVFKLPFNDDVEENWKDINVSINNGEHIFHFNDSANINPAGPHRFVAETTVESINFESPIVLDIDVTRIAATDYQYECDVSGYTQDISEDMCESIYSGRVEIGLCCGQSVGTTTNSEWGTHLTGQTASCFRGNKIDTVDISESVNKDYSTVLHSQGDFHVCGENLPHPEGVPPSNIETYETGNTYTPVSEEGSEYICGQGEWIVFDGQDRIPTLLSHAHRLVEGVTNEHKILCGPMNRILPSVNEPHVSCLVSNRENNQAIGLLTMASSSEELATATSQAQDFNGSMIGDSCYSEEENGFQRCNNFVSDNLIKEGTLTSVEPALYVNTNYNISVITTLNQSDLPGNYNYPDGGLASILQRIGHIVSEFFDAGEEFVLPTEGSLEATYVESSDETQIISSFIKDGQSGKITYRITPGLEDPSEIDRRFDLTFGNLVGDKTINSTTEETRLELDSGVAMDTSYYDAWRTFASIR